MPGYAGSPATPRPTLVSVPGWPPVESAIVLPLVSSMCQVDVVDAARAAAGSTVTSPVTRATTASRVTDR